MFSFVITIHVVACVLLIIIVLIQQGRGGGLIDSLSSAESVFGTKTNSFLVKSTSIFAVVFFVTCLSLAFLSIQKSKSLIETKYQPIAHPLPPNVNQTAASSPNEKESQARTGVPNAVNLQKSSSSMSSTVDANDIKQTLNASEQAETKK
jgi:preprotein translocase subunit SecG